MSRAMRRILVLLGVVSVLAACGGPGEGPPPPEPVLDAMEPRVAQRMKSAREEVLRQPGSAEAWGRLGAVYAVHDLHEEAEICHAEAVRLAPDEFRWAYFLAIARAFNGAPQEEVAKRFRSASRLRPDYVPLYVRWGRALAKRGRHEAAIEAFSRALELQPGFPPAEIGAGQSWLGLGDAERALAHLEPVAATPGVDARAIASLSQAYHMLGREAEAARAAEVARRGVMRGTFDDPVWVESVEEEGISSSACYKRARRKLQQGRHAEAIEDLLIVEEVEPGRAGVQAMLGSAYRGLGQNERAIEHLSVAVKLRDDQPWVRRELGELLEQAGQLRPALEQYAAAIELDPQNPAHHIAVVRVRSALGDLRGAIVALRSGILRLPENADLHFLLGLALRDAGRPGGALRELETSLALAPSTARTHYQLGVTLEQIGRPGEAMTHYREAVAIDPNHVARERLERLTGSR